DYPYMINNEYNSSTEYERHCVSWRSVAILLFKNNSESELKAMNGREITVSKRLKKMRTNKRTFYY
ncbi:30874_t:CDS:2, partial [Gigaspora margarita]